MFRGGIVSILVEGCWRWSCQTTYSFKHTQIFLYLSPVSCLNREGKTWNSKHQLINLDTSRSESFFFLFVMLTSLCGSFQN
uniref:Uncharacterized protein n=1 Tax=Anabas testudineus TaxID=64144 RepID=A0A3Q1IA23_ANATE